MATRDKTSDVTSGETTDETEAREYLRVSYDRSGRERSNVEQQADNRQAWPDFTFGRHYADTTSASRYAAKQRGDWKVLIGDLEADRFSAGVLVLWESSRGSRKVGEWVELIELCEQRQVLIAVTTHNRIYDPAVPRDRRSLLDDAVDSEYESAKISARAKRATAASAEAGRPHGQVPYGYRRRYDEVTRRLIAQEPEPAEAAVISELFERLEAGHSLRAIARDFEARGIRTRSGLVFAPPTLGDLARRETYRGKRTFTPGAGRTMTRTERRKLATVTDAVWPAIVPERRWLAVQRVLDDPARTTTRPGGARHLLSMIMRCDPCSGPMAVSMRKERGRTVPPEYVCRNKGCVRLGKAGVDEIAEAAIVGYLSRPDNVERLLADDGDDQALEAARTEVAKIRAELDDLVDQVGRGELTATFAAKAEPAILKRLRAAEAHETELATPPMLRGLIEPGDDVAERWAAAPISTKRRIARMLLVPEILGELRIARSPVAGHRVPPVERMVWRTTQPDDLDATG